ncbi:MAG: phosphoribosylamine--glycine ligase [Deltaproteobacteria bacterium]|nr:phosphoribosylamine--glycine ligase [Deltaproteobacteria bacterium]
MNVLVIGAGGREHSLCWRLANSKTVTRVFCAPGNPGTALVAENVDLSRTEDLIDFAKTNSIELTVVGPEAPLCDGVVDEFQNAGLRIFGPQHSAAELEASKAFAKEIMNAAKIPNAACHEFSDYESAKRHCDNISAPVVLKADGLAAGKGVVVCHKQQEISEGLSFLFETIKADRVLVEDFLEGVEASYIIAANGKVAVPMASSHDYKRLNDGQTGPNTGGMGTVSPTTNLTSDQESWVMQHIMQPVLDQMVARDKPFKGFLYAGLMIAPDGTINVLEFNVRMGDPECQSIMRRFEGDFAQMLIALCDNKELPEFSWSRSAAVCIVAAADGYPVNVVKGDQIFGLEQAEQIPGVVVFQAGTKIIDGKLVTNGGRVLNVTALGATHQEARANAYKAMDMVQFRGKHIRRDIGA